MDINTCKHYNYLGVWLSEKSSCKKQRAEITKKSNAIIYALKKLHHKLPAPSVVPILKIIKAKLLPAINYGHLAYPGQLDTLMESFQLKAHKTNLAIATYARGARVRAELGLTSVDMTNKSACINYDLATTRAPKGSVKSVNKLIYENKVSPWARYIENAVHALNIV